MINAQTQEIIDLNKVEIDPVTCVACIDWNKVPISSARNDWERGKLLVAQTFEDISWYEYPGSLTGMISEIHKALPQSKKYQYIIQGFSDTLIVDIMKIVKKRGTQKSLN